MCYKTAPFRGKLNDGSIHSWYICFLPSVHREMKGIWIEFLIISFLVFTMASCIVFDIDDDYRIRNLFYSVSMDMF